MARHQLQRTLVAAQASLERSMADTTFAVKKSINILESSVTDLVGQRDEQQQALCKSPLALATLKEHCSKLNEAVMWGERRLASTRAERNPSSSVVVTGPFIKKFPCNHSVNINIIIFFFRRSKRQRNFSLFYFASQES
jgi:hypothetical protein